MTAAEFGVSASRIASDSYGRRRVRRRRRAIVPTAGRLVEAAEWCAAEDVLDGKFGRTHYKPEHVAPALTKKIQALRDALRRSLTWDQGPEMRNCKQVRVDADIDVYFCDPHAPWQRGSNENTNGLLRQYFAKGTDFATVTEAELDAVADELNDRPRQRLAFAKPIEEISQLLLQ